ncbi:hypothetical protein [Planomicrobium sp. CPCC 101079]|nr:hypothetical protein [Planomicrobium sp. CPCC 101079]
MSENAAVDFRNPKVFKVHEFKANDRGTKHRLAETAGLFTRV